MDASQKWLKEQVEVMDLTHRQGKPAKCPDDGGLIKFVEVTRPGSMRPEYAITCPICGKGARATPN
jgi:hypothetical protein